MQSELFAEPLSVPQLPDADIHYYPDFVPNADDGMQRLMTEIAWRQDTITVYGRPVLIPRLNAWYGDPQAHYSYSGLALQPLPWTETLLLLKGQLEQFLGERFNSVLANRYRDGNDSVSWHSDDEEELGKMPLIASISLGATRRFSMRHRNYRSLRPVHLDLQAGSLLIMRGPTQRFWYHQLPKTKTPVGERINLTFRQIINPQ